MPLPRVEYKVDRYNSGQYIVVKMVDGEPEKEEGKYWDLDEAKRAALELQLNLIATTLFPYDKDPHAEGKTDTLVDITRRYFMDLLRLLPINDDAQYARSLVRQAFNFAQSAILLDGMV